MASSEVEDRMYRGVIDECCICESETKYVCLSCWNALCLHCASIRGLCGECEKYSDAEDEF